ncbi:MAG: DUF885 domain-containing protein, partial [Actinomycetota bacterium]
MTTSQTSAVYALSDRFIEQLAALDPGMATALGIPGHDHEMTDFSPAGHDARGQVVRDTLTELNATEAITDADRLAAGV